MAEPQVNEAAVAANQSISPAVNGNDTSQPTSNGITTATSTDNPEPDAPKSPMQESAPSAPRPSSTDPVATSSNGALEDPKEPVISSTAPETSPKAQSSPSSPAPQQEPVVSAVTSLSEPPPSSLSPKQEPSAQPREELSAQTALSTTELTQPEDVSSPTAPSTAEKRDVRPSEHLRPEKQSPGDQEMLDAPPMSPTKVSREREDDANEEPAAKRAKTDETSPSDTTFKVPDLPPASTSVVDSTHPAPAITKLQTKFLIRIIQTLKRVKDAVFFRDPVDYVKLNIPNYPTIIKEPMDMRTMEEKLKDDKYASVDAVVADFRLMVNNSTTFNGPDHPVAQQGRNLQKSFEKHLEKLPGPDAVEEKKMKKVLTVPTKTQPARRESRVSGGNSKPASAASPSTTFALGPEGLPTIRRDSSTADGRPKRSIHPPKNRDLPYSAKPKKKKYQWELKFCQEALDELQKGKYYSIAAPFYVPVDPVALNIPNYHSIIKKPMDLQTIQTKLKTGQYENAKEMEADVRQIFKNCYKFNIPGDPIYTAGKRLEDIFDNKWAQKARWIEAHEPSSGHQSAGSSDNGSEDEDEESDEDIDDEKLTLLQKQIAEMSKQVEAITQKKKKTPPVKKSSKAKSGKKDSKKGPSGTSSKKDRKGSRSGKPEKQRWVTYREKQIISNGISSLPDKRMQEALRIIQNNVPSLKGTQETEIELDIDELPNEVLLMLLKFVKKHAPQAMEIDEPEPEPEPAVAPSRPKKNKPMTKHEQEAQINRLTGSLSRFQAGGGSSDLVPSVEALAESSEDEDDSSESEEE
ncbi:hypothetical protein AJ80_00990 [Polytolypa hystricis UAMH7299]|uniref:Bromo domain-containing protein n=1 Tax=Polytolypa hystricis (strain UAMH7299) TaxID=1447883 RepID=A0A2B7Z1J9_POLH7|nr:hypothetical protein AJ80_00990 [Polytolypa hystricis UAMH7299]